MSTPPSSDHVTKVIRKRRKRRIWTSEERDRLLAGVEQFKNKKGKPVWKLVAGFVKTRDQRQCRDRYSDVEVPFLSINKHNPFAIHRTKGRQWMKPEVDRLYELIRAHGRKWAKISKLMLPLHVRTPNQIKSKFYDDIRKSAGILRPPKEATVVNDRQLLVDASASENDLDDSDTSIAGYSNLPPPLLKGFNPLQMHQSPPTPPPAPPTIAVMMPSTPVDLSVKVPTSYTPSTVELLTTSGIDVTLLKNHLGIRLICDLLGEGVASALVGPNGEDLLTGEYF
eukprot:gnl/Dysnectes_brevis/7433_a12434_272.p1 GENE.gnl/Dysnectes_brevis/7433_a12434_272~~gnl/Dysnectes_brevis/7433_a12434_272.p1  ORF type:complete len:282 (-),score=50.60 gnl/Dysnectes_brevis/7433_a12434_272:119-964(-)